MRSQPDWEKQETVFPDHNYDYYLYLAIMRERALLPYANCPETENRPYYGTNRDTVGQFSLPYIQQMIKTHTEQVSVLELGGGEGNSSFFVLKNLPQTTITLTSLTRLPVHDTLEMEGIRVCTPVLAEHLPKHWERSFHCVISQCLLGWTHMEQAIREIERVLAENGVWCALESLEGTPLHTHLPYSWAVPDIAEQLRLSNALSPYERNAWAKKGFSAFVYRKA